MVSNENDWKMLKIVYTGGAKMPLSKGYSEKSVKKNIKKLKEEGYDAKGGKQGVAIALQSACSACKKAGKKQCDTCRAK